jgi:4-amino-4-deoxy-L-arabinose transferase-like glycosyltransferase
MNLLTRQVYAGRYAASLYVIACCLLFISLGLIVIPYPGIQNDEALFGSPLYTPRTWHAKIRVFHNDVPVMLMSYLGTLKSWIYIPWFRLWAPSAMSIRVPVLLVGAATVWLFFLLLMRVSDRRAALAGAALLATDVSFLLTTCLDWGPVALQHLLFVLGVLLLVKFHQNGDNWALAVGFFVFGLGLWDKALFIWPLIGLVAATILVFPKEVIRHLSARRAAIATLCFLVGASPLVVYNVESRGGTTGAYTSASFKDLENKIRDLQRTLDGSVLLGYLTGEDGMDNPRSPRSTLERASIWVHLKTGNHRRNLNSVAFLLALGLVPFLWRKTAGRALRFTFIFLTVAWLQMAMTAGAGGAAHHTVLLWPFPIFLVAIAFSEMSKRLPWGRLALATALIIMVGQNLLVYNQHLAQFIRDGESGSWTDAIFPLSNRLMRYVPNQIYVIDWGMLNSLRLLSKGHLLLNEASYPLTLPEPGDDGRRILLAEISDPSHVFVAYTLPFEQFKGVGQHLSKWASECGYERVLIETIKDRNWRPVFEVFRFAKSNVQHSCDPI